MSEDKTTLLLRIFVGKDDYIDNNPLYEKIIYAANEAGLAGATATEGVMSFGANSVIHKSKMVLSADLPVVVEIVDEEEKIMNFMDKLDELFEQANGGGLITYEEISVKYYGASKKSAD